MKHSSQGYIVVFDRSQRNLRLFQKALSKRQIKMFGTNNLFLLLNYLKELHIDALMVTVHHGDKPAQALLEELSKQHLRFPLIILKPQHLQINSAIKAAHYITEDDSSQRLLNILESYNLGNKQHQVMLLNLSLIHI